MKILIIGGTGLISTAITHLLVERGEDEVVLFNRGQSFYPTPPGVRTIHGDRTDHAAFKAQIREAGTFDCVIDMIGYQPEEASNAVETFEGRIGQLVFCSTVDVYRKPASRYPYTEAESYGGLNAYGRNKVLCEKILLDAHARGAFPLTIIRPAYTYGEGRGPVHSFGGSTSYLDRIRKGKPIVVHGDGSSFWTACYREDVARAFVAAIAQPRAFGRAYHTAGEEWLTWNAYHQKVAEALGAAPPKLVHIPSDLLGRVAPKRAAVVVENFQFNNLFDNSAARADLAFTYTVDWMSGVRRMVRWLDEHNQVQDSDLDTFEDRLISAWQSLGSKMADEVKED